MTPLKGITVCVEYDDLLALTLPYNLHHFTDFLVVTSPTDEATQHLCSLLGVRCYATDAFYRNGADFNKWLALEEGLDELGREGWIAVLDADIFWPAEIHRNWEMGNIYTPARYQLEDVRAKIPPEDQWNRLTLLNEAGCPGWTQIFHASDPHLPVTPPWYQTDWRHAGGADTYFHELWPKQNWKRTLWRVLHLGPSWTNWCGRVSARIDGREVQQRTERQQRQTAMLSHRNPRANYANERLA